jgi:hypothetical protein
MVNSALATGDFDLSPGDKVYIVCLRYIAGKMMLIRSFILGLRLILWR